MKTSGQSPNNTAGQFRWIIGFIVAVWIVFIVDWFLPLERFALYPRRFGGLPGIAISPFLHKGISHIVSNTLPLIVLMGLLAGSRADSKKVIVTIILASGTLLWVLGRAIPVVGASGLVFGLIGFLLASGFFERRPLTIAVAGFVGLSYGTGVLAGIMPGQSGISWDGHLYGLISGVICAWLFARER